ncbi:DUF2987 domain-containing protein [Oceanisphaera sp. IT1-181]|uniref:DUF2987 domain-containing protein n=1 Tax=Oceanisphaera sp. IT1-181 TaxID=3081199 RepID=UPI0029CA70B7|nr:DUF2987 domain-containing protein [Oceanisphaera sp. IT1-181]
MKTSRLLAWCAVLTLTFGSPMLQAQTLELDYSGFYKYLAKVKKAKVEQAELGFYLSRADGQGLCTIESGVIRVDDEVRGQVTVLPHGQFTLTEDKELDLDKAKVVLEVVEETQCNISIQIQSNLTAGNRDLSELRAIEDDMYRLLQKMAGWPGKYFVPELQGLTLNPAVPGGHVAGKVQLKLSQAQLTETGSLSLPAVRITPWF